VAKNQPIILTVADHKIGAIDKLADELRSKGMQVDRVLPITGVIAGSAPTKRLPALRKIDGVLSIEPETEAVLPPPDEPQ
jgi:hypothetical protein